MNIETATAAPARMQASILIVDDDAAAVEIFDAILRSAGYHVRAATDAQQALAEIQRAAPSAVLLDLHLPVMDGLAFLRQLRAEVPDARIPVALVTGDYFLEEEIATEVRSLGARVHFKPLWDDDLLKLVDELLHTR